MGLRLTFLITSVSICLLPSLLPAENEIPDREPDVQSVRANLKDYYTYDPDTRKWIWSDDYEKIKAKRKATAKLKKVVAEPTTEAEMETTETIEEALPEETASDEIPSPESSCESESSCDCVTITTTQTQAEQQTQEQKQAQVQQTQVTPTTVKKKEPFDLGKILEKNTNILEEKVESKDQKIEGKENMGFFQNFWQKIKEMFAAIIAKITNLFKK